MVTVLGRGHASCLIPRLEEEVESLDHGRSCILLMISMIALVGCANGGPAPSTSGSNDVLDRDATTPPPPPPSDCGNLGNPCCAGRCEGDLMCIDDLCGRSACGAMNEPCCDGTPACFAGLSCTADGCQMPGTSSACGERGQACCVGATPCSSGLECQAGSCLAVTSSGDAGMPPPPPDSGAPPPPPPPADPCAGATDCLDCTSRETCGFCDGRCIESDFLGPATCGDYAWFTFECVL